MSDMTQHTPADHLGGEMSERTMEKARQVVHRLSEWYFAEGGDNDPDSPIDREDLDALHELVRTAEATLRTPRGEGERVKEPTQEQIDDACLWYRHDFGLLSEKERDSVRFEARQWFRAWGKALSNGDDPAALLRTPRGDGEDTIPVSALRSEIAQLRAHRLLPYLAWARLCALAGGEPVGEDNPAARRSDAQGEDRWEDLVFGPITEAYNEAHAARRGEGGGNGLE